MPGLERCQVNFYPHHIGDYLTATAHLSWLEDCAYRRLLDVYYSREQSLPADVTQACRLVRALSKDERKAVETVLHEFFTATGQGWTHGRCEEEIEKWKARGWFPSEGPQLRQPVDEWKRTRVRIFQRDGYVCRYCRKAHVQLECDHVIPVSRGGSNDDSNLATACRPCNRRKSNKMPSQFEAAV